VAGAPPAEVFIDFVYQPVVDANGAVTGIFVQGHDVTEQHRAVQALREGDRRKDEFLATLAHELRNPLAPIRQAALLAQADSATEAQKRWGLRVIERQAQHMALLLDDLLDMARVSSGRLELRRQPLQLQAALDAAVEAARPLIESKQHALRLEPPPAPLLLHADPLRITQILSNLLTNAAKYTDARGSITVSAAANDGWVEVRVRDNGIGLASDAVERIFEMFSQVKSALDRSEGGLGIGLALSRGLAQLHDGTLEATSAGPGHGSTFVLRLPLEPGEPSDPATAATTPARREGSCRVLLADDNADAVESLAALLQLEGHDVQIARNGDEALALAETARPQVAIVDIGMPGLNGYEVARRLRAAEWGHGLRLIALTGWGQAQDRERALQAGFDHHCTKPLDLGVLLPLLRSKGEASPPGLH
jgi:CheY-like chemotaxis protein